MSIPLSLPRVAVRISPDTNGDNDVGASLLVDYQAACITHNHIQYKVDSVFQPTDVNAMVYKSMAKSFVQSAVLEGYSAVIAAYGGDGTGKSSTITGDTLGGPGILPRTIHDIFRIIANSNGKEFLLRSSYYQVDASTGFVTDLLSPQLNCVNVNADGNIEGLREEAISTEKQLLSIVAHKQPQRLVSQTSSNYKSNCAHTIFQITIESRYIHDVSGSHNMDESCLLSVIKIIDFASPSKDSCGILADWRDSMIDTSHASSKVLSKLLPLVHLERSNICLVFTLSLQSRVAEESAEALKWIQKFKSVSISPLPKILSKGSSSEISLLVRFSNQVRAYQQNLRRETTEFSRTLKEKANDTTQAIDAVQLADTLSKKEAHIKRMQSLILTGSKSEKENRRETWCPDPDQLLGLISVPSGEQEKKRLFTTPGPSSKLLKLGKTPVAMSQAVLSPSKVEMTETITSLRNAVSKFHIDIQKAREEKAFYEGWARELEMECDAKDYSVSESLKNFQKEKKARERMENAFQRVESKMEQIISISDEHLELKTRELESALETIQALEANISNTRITNLEQENQILSLRCHELEKQLQEAIEHSKPHPIHRPLYSFSDVVLHNGIEETVSSSTCKSCERLRDQLSVARRDLKAHDVLNNRLTSDASKDKTEIMELESRLNEEVKTRMLAEDRIDQLNCTVSEYHKKLEVAATKVEMVNEMAFNSKKPLPCSRCSVAEGVAASLTVELHRRSESHAESRCDIPKLESQLSSALILLNHHQETSENITCQLKEIVTAVNMSTNAADGAATTALGLAFTQHQLGKKLDALQKEYETFSSESSCSTDSSNYEKRILMLEAEVQRLREANETLRISEDVMRTTVKRLTNEKITTGSPFRNSPNVKEKMFQVSPESVASFPRKNATLNNIDTIGTVVINENNENDPRRNTTDSKPSRRRSSRKFASVLSSINVNSPVAMGMSPNIMNKKNEEIDIPLKVGDHDFSSSSLSGSSTIKNTTDFGGVKENVPVPVAASKPRPPMCATQ